jgi:energy-coupling factor transporter ATP-binding protein EcfA2
MEINEREIKLKNISDIKQIAMFHQVLANDCLMFESEIENSSEIITYLQIINDFLPLISKCEEICINIHTHMNYINHISGIISGLKPLLVYHKTISLRKKIEVEKVENARALAQNYLPKTQQLKQQLERLSFSLYFFGKLGFFTENITAIGANGSGKTSLVNKLKEALENNGVVIPAQKILLLDKNNTINDPLSTANELKQFQIMDKSSKANNINQTQKEFSAVINNLLAENNSESNKYKNLAIEQSRAKLDIPPPPQSKLYKSIEIWNSLISHRLMKCEDGFNLTLEQPDETPYFTNNASDGEKVLLYIISHILQAPKNGFIVVDEPEMYLNKSIVSKIWDKLEKERSDCVFIYLTHDIEFASSRKDSKKLWVKSFQYPMNWDIEEIPKNKIPEKLVMELLGSRKNILFCEGEISSSDEKVLNILFPNLTIKPVSSCENVINYTKALNQVDSMSTQAIGLIDSDHHNENRLTSLEKHNVFNFSVAEIENLLLDEELLLDLAKNNMCDQSDVNQIKSLVIKKFGDDIELQVSNYISANIDYLYKSAHVKKGNTLEEVSKHYDDFNAQIDVHKTYKERSEFITSVINENNYEKVIQSYNNKGLKVIVNNKLNITNFTERMIKLIKNRECNNEFINRYFPIEIVNANK